MSATGSRNMRVLRVLAWVSGLAGCALLLYTAFLVWDPFAAHRQHALVGNLDHLRPGNIITVATKCDIYRYAVQSKHVVRYTDIAVLDPVPGQPGEHPRKQLITLITCTPVTLAFTPYRLIVTGQLVSVTQRV